MNPGLARIALLTGLVAAYASGPSPAQPPDAPSLPKGHSAPPARLLGGLAEFAAEVYRPVPEAENAQSAYLGALSEFDPEMARCWPEEGRRQRRDDLRDRVKRLRAALDPAELRGMPIDREARDAAIAEFRRGWEGLVRAQQRPRCRFEIATVAGADTPHAFAARQVERVARLLASADLKKGDLDAALGRLAVVLRLGRDLRPGGNAVCQIASVALDASACRDVALPILQSPALRPEHCDRLVTLLRDQERDGLDPFRAPLIPEALAARWSLTELRSDRGLRAKVAEMFRRDVPGAFGDVLGDLTGAARRGDSGAANRRVGDQLAAMTDADFAAALEGVDAYFGRWWRLGPSSYEARVRAAPEFAREALGDNPLLGALIPDPSFFIAMAETSARESYTLRAAQSLAAVRRWTVEHGGPPPDLAAAVRAAGLPEAPRDPFADAPLRLIVADGSPAVYSIGPDRKDDGGKVDARLGRRRDGDWITGLPARAPAR